MLMGSTISRGIGLTFIVMLFFIACTKHSDVAQNPQSPQYEAASITIVSGNDQTGQGGCSLTDPVVVRITDTDDQPCEDILVYFHVVEGGGRVVGEAGVMTDSLGRAEIRWEIGSGYNGIEVRIMDGCYRASPRYVLAEGENPTGVQVTRTIASLERVDDALYTFTFYGDDGAILDAVNQNIIDWASQRPSATQDYFCSLFSVLGNADQVLFGRSFDNPEGWRCLTVVGRYHPPDGYGSLVLIRMRDFGFELNTNFDLVSFEDKRRLLEAGYWVPDGINAHGVVAGLAQTPPQTFVPDPGKTSIYKTRLIREILDHARDVDEAVDITMQYNVFEDNLSTLSNHVLVADASGRSVILELNNRQMRVIPNTEDWQVMTNSLVYNRSEEVRKAQCRRYEIIYNTLEAAGGVVDYDQCMSLLEQVGNIYTQWSALYDMTEKKIILAVDYNFQNLFEFSLEDN